MKIICVVLGALFIPLSQAGADAIRYTVTNLGSLGGPLTEANAINSSGRIAGTAMTDPQLHQRAFRYQDGVMTDLGIAMGTLNSRGYAINSSGNVVGDSVYSNAVSHACLFDGATVTDLGTLGGTFSTAFGINAFGKITGESNITGNTATHAFIYDAGVMSTIGTLGGTDSHGFGINDSGEVVGWSNINTGAIHAFIYRPGSAMSDLGTLGGTGSIAYAINNAGHVVGFSGLADSSQHAFFFNGSTMQDLGVISGGNNSFAYAINSSDQVVGVSEIDDMSTSSAMIYSGGRMSDLNTMLASGSNVTLTRATGINDAGQITCVGNAGTESETRSFLLTPQNVLSPIVKISGKKKITTSKAKITIKGTVAGEVDSVTYTIGKKTGTASGTAAWKFKAKLKTGKNKITVIAHGYGGDSTPAKVTVIRN